MIWVKLLAGRGLLVGRSLLAELTLEAGHPAASVQDLLLARVDGWQFAHMSAWMTPLRAVDRVVKVFPHVQVTVVTT